jgi:hypothetical protein
MVPVAEASVTNHARRIFLASQNRVLYDGARFQMTNLTGVGNYYWSGPFAWMGLPPMLLITKCSARARRELPPRQISLTWMKNPSDLSVIAIDDEYGDGEPDLILHFKTQDAGIQCGQSIASLSGKTVDGLTIEEFDLMQIVHRTTTRANISSESKAAHERPCTKESFFRAASSM